MSDEPVIREACPADEAVITEIASQAYAMYVPLMNMKPYPMLDDYKAHIRAGSAFVIESHGSVSGYVILIIKNSSTLLLDNIAVLPTRQKAGYGRKLLEFADRYAIERHMKKIILYTNKVMKENIGWYRKHGYVITHECEEMGYKRIFFKKTFPEQI